MKTNLNSLDELRSYEKEDPSYIIYYGISKETYKNEKYKNHILKTLYNNGYIYFIILDLDIYKIPILIKNKYQYNNFILELEKYYNTKNVR